MRRAPATIESDAIDVAGESELRGSDGQDRSVRPKASGLGGLPGRLSGLSLRRQVLVLSIWPLLEQLLNFLVGTVDLALAGHLSPEGLAVAATDALGVSGYVGWLMAMVHSAAGIGSATLIARAVGGRHRGLANAALGQSIVLGLLIGLVVGATIFLLSGLIGEICGLRGEGLQLCRMYLRIISLAAPASALLLVGNAALRGAGDTRSPFTVMVFVNIVNVILSVLFVFGPAPLGGHGVKGIAWGTVGAWMLGSVLVLGVLWRGNGGVRLFWGRLRPHWHTMRRIIHVGVPNLMESVLGIWLGNFLILIIVGQLGQEAVIGAHQVVIRIEAISFLPGFAMGIAGATLAGQYLGSGDPKRARQAVFVCWTYAAVIMTLMGGVFVLVPHLLVRLITNAGPLLELAPVPLRICGPFQLFLATHMVFAAALRGAGDTRRAMWITMFSTFAVRVPAAYVLSTVFGLGLNGVWYGMCSEMVVSGVLFAGRFYRGAWAKMKV